jgi:hypothetical protein
MSERETVIIELKNQMVQLILAPFDTDVDLDDMLKIQDHNVYGELTTISRLLNKVGNLKAEQQEILSQAKLDFDIFYSQMLEEKRKELTFTETSTGKVNKPTVSEIEASIIRTPQYKVKKTKIFEVQKNMDYIESFYESVKNKSFIIMKLSDKTKPDDFEKEIVEGSVNGVMIKFSKKSIK